MHGFLFRQTISLDYSSELLWSKLIPKDKSPQNQCGSFSDNDTSFLPPKHVKALNADSVSDYGQQAVTINQKHFTTLVKSSTIAQISCNKDKEEIF